MSNLEKIAWLFAKKNRFNITPIDNGFQAVKGRVILNYIGGGNHQSLYCSKSLIPGGQTDESSISVEIPKSSSERRLFTNIRFGCLRDYLTQLRGAKKPVLKELTARLEYELGSNDDALYNVEEKFTDFGLFDVYHLLERFYP